MDVVAALEQRGFARIARGEDGGTDDLARAGCCFSCIRQNLRNSTVRRLRALLGVSTNG